MVKSKKNDLHAFVRESVEPQSALCSDALKSYEGLGEEYAHQVIDHAVEYVRDSVHTNHTESFWRLLKRGINGTYFPSSPSLRYVDQQAFRHNNREAMTDADRFNLVLAQLTRKKVTWESLSGRSLELQDRPLSN